MRMTGLDPRFVGGKEKDWPALASQLLYLAQILVATLDNLRRFCYKGVPRAFLVCEGKLFSDHLHYHPGQSR